MWGNRMIARPDVVIVSTARTPVAKAFRGAFNQTHGATLAGHAVRHAVDRSGLHPSDIDDVLLGCAMPEGATGYNIARLSALRAGLPVTASGVTVDRQCASGVQAIAFGAYRIANEGVAAVVAGGVEQITLVQAPNGENFKREEWLTAHRPEVWMSMIDTAEIVAARYGIKRHDQDAYALESHRRAVTAREQGAFRDEIAPISVTMSVRDRDSGEPCDLSVIIEQDEGPRADTTLERLSALKPVVDPQGSVTPGNSCQLSDGASACVLMDGTVAASCNIPALGVFRGFAVAGCSPEEMGIGPVVAVPKLLARHGLAVDDIDLWELNEAFACQALYCIEKLRLPADRVNVNGGAIALGHPYGMTGSRCVGHLLLEGRRRKAKFGVVTMCIGGGMGAACLLEILQ
jgi:acetyl-CoA C-acetyltransferase